MKRILRAYENALGTTLVDRPAILRRAIAAVRRGQGGTPRLLIPARRKLSPIEREFVEALAGTAVTPLPEDAPEDWLRPGNRHRFFRAVGEENEIREIFRRALAERIPFDEVEVLYTDRSSYLSLAYELAEQYGVPATFFDRIDVAYTRPGRAVLGFLDWLTSDFGERELRSLLRAGALDVGKLSGVDDLTGAGAARILRRARIGWGGGRYLPRLRSYAASVRAGEASRRRRGEDERDPARTEREIRNAAAVERLVDRMLRSAPVSTVGDRVSLRALSAACAAVVEAFARSASELDGVAAAAIPRVLDDLAFLGDEPSPLPDAAARIREAVSDLFVGGSPVTQPRPGGIHFAGIEDGGFTGRPHTFIVGLDESRHPGGGLQDPVLLDAERRRLNASEAVELPMRGDSASERTRGVFAAIARLRGNVTFSYSCHDLAEDREIFPSAALLEVFRAVSGEPEAGAAALAAAGGPPAGYFPDRSALDGAEWWLGKLRETGRPLAGRAAVEHAYPGLADGTAAREARLSDRITRWDGAIESAGSSLDPRENGGPISASRLQALADCPFAYFVRYVLGAEPPDEIAREPGVWLGPMDLGSLLHEVFREFMEETAAAGRKPALSRDRARIEGIAGEAIERWKREVPPPNDAVLERQRRAVMRACETFLRSEEREGSIEPFGFEVGFGSGPADEIAIAAGKGTTVRVRGSIDRVDRAADGSYEIWDYKTGSNFAYDPSRGLDGGRRIQPAFYAAAFEERLRRSGNPGRVSKAGFIFVGPRSDGRREDFGYDRGELPRVLSKLCDVLASGAFLHGTGDCCAFCPYESVCGGRVAAVAAARRKTSDPDNARLAAGPED